MSTSQIIDICLLNIGMENMNFGEMSTYTIYTDIHNINIYNNIIIYITYTYKQLNNYIIYTYIQLKTRLTRFS